MNISVFVPLTIHKYKNSAAIEVYFLGKELTYKPEFSSL